MKSILSILMLIISLQCTLGQNKIEGKYTWTDPAGLNSQQLEFNQSKAIYTSSPDFGNAVSLTGVFEQKGNIIKLFFDEFELSSHFEITKNEVLKNNKSKFIKIKILDGEQSLQPFFGAMAFLNICKNSGIQLLSDKNGMIDFQTSGEKQLDSLVINFIGYESLVVPLKDTFNDLEISCVLYLSKNNGLANVPNEIQITDDRKAVIDIKRNLIYKRVSK
nr:hypothetical protein [Pseudopedobacter sp.]